MTWFKVDDKFYGHRKRRRLSMAAIGLWTLAGSYCADHLTDGVLEPSDIDWLGGDLELAAELVRAGLWDEHERGYQFHDWDEYQPSRESREREREKWRERQAARRERAKNDTSVLPVPSRPESRRDSRRDTCVTSEPAEPELVTAVVADIRSQLRGTR